MKPISLMKKLAWVFGAMGVLLVFIGLDWLPTVKDLNRLRREQHDEVLKIKNLTSIASGFVFPDAEEKSLLAQNETWLYRSLPQMNDNDAWQALALLELLAQAKAEGIADARVYFSSHAIGSESENDGQGRPAAFDGWLCLQSRDIQKSFQFTEDPSRYPWYGVFHGIKVIPSQWVTSRTLAVALIAPLPALLHFINHVSWGKARLEIVRMHLEPGVTLSRAWLICRGNYLASMPSDRAVQEVAGSSSDNLLVDADSPLLWQPVGYGAAGMVGKNELPPLGSPW